MHKEERLFTPRNFQPKLPVEKLILREKPAADAVLFDVLFVGGGPAGLAGAIELARLAHADAGEKHGAIEIGVLEKASALGEHCLSGAIIAPQPLFDLFPD